MKYSCTVKVIMMTEPVFIPKPGASSYSSNGEGAAAFVSLIRN